MWSSTTMNTPVMHSIAKATAPMVSASQNESSVTPPTIIARAGTLTEIIAR